jgi:shikimate kinase
VAKILALSGFMGSGKSSIGRRVAQRLGRHFFDLDEEVVRSQGRPIERIFAEDGEIAFRRAEEAELTRILENHASTGPVVALGGGTVTWGASAALLASNAFVVLISVPVSILWERVRDIPGRPLARTRDSFLSLATARGASYRETADAIVDGEGLSEDAIADRIVALFAQAERAEATLEGGSE